jgi:para-aminobenzoate synthetase/4-amino-4-deoxychorismate lyase
VLRATTVDEVLPALDEIDRAVAAGLHAAGFVAYEAAPAMDNALACRTAHPALPLLTFGIFRDRIDAPLSLDSERVGAGTFGEPLPMTGPDEYERAIKRILDYIGAGDTYQVNYTFPLRGTFQGDPDDLYRSLCRAQHSEYCAMLRFEDVAILSASPELFFSWRDGELRMKPMKGTRPRGRWTEEDDALAEALRTSAKDRAENLMIVDLLRNDLGRIARFGSVNVESLYDIERYPTVHQMTSTVVAKTTPEASLRDVFRALFPSGSVTGAPKVRTSEIILELEPSPRGVYTGAIGFASPGEAVFSVAIRTVLLDLTSGVYELGVGSGITADSDPAAEYAECLSKAAFLRAEAPRVGLIESLRLEHPGGFRRLKRHLARMQRSARYFGFPFEPDAARQELDHLAAGLAPGIYKARLELDAAGRLTSTAEAIPATLPTARLGMARTPVSSTDRFLYHKTTRREPYQRALADRPDCDDVILWNEKGELTETTVGNLVLELDGELVTPSLPAGLLPGVFREELLERGAIAERTLARADLDRAARVFVINSVREWRPALLRNQG